MGLEQIEIDGVTFSVPEGSGQAEKLQQLIEARNELADAGMESSPDRHAKGVRRPRKPLRLSAQAKLKMPAKRKDPRANERTTLHS